MREMKRKKNSKRISLARGLEKPVWKVRLICGLIFLLFLGVFIKAFELQVLNRGPALSLARKQHEGSFTLLPRRGRILDARKRELSVNVDAESIYVRLKDVRNSQGFSKKLSRYLGVSQIEVLNMILSRKPFFWVKRLAEPELVAKLKEANLSGINFIEEPKRVYPNGYLAGQVLGFTDVDSKGIEGVEYYLDSFLAGKPGKIIVKKDARGKEIVSAPVNVEQSTSGYDAVLTIDSQIQYIVEKELKEGVDKTGAQRGIALLMNSETGALMAMASYPFFDPNKPDKYPGEIKRNLPIWYSFEPGSTMKAFLVAAALEEKKVTPDSQFNCENGKRRLGSKIINDVHPYGVLTVAEVVKVSSNICASKIGEVLGGDKLYDYLKRFGFGEKTGIGLPGESSGKLRSSRDWRPIELATISFGQGISVTAIQLASALSAIANGGYLVKPYLVDKIIGRDGKVIEERKPEVVRRVISYDTAKEVTRILEGVITKGGTGESAAVPGYRIAGKTGTAQIPNPQTGGYYTDRHMASFIGFAPADDPKITLVVIVESPKTSPYGGVVAAPIFKGIMEKVLFYLGIPPEKVFAESRIMPNLLGMSARDVLKWAEKEGIEVKLKGSGSVANQKPQAGEIIKDNTVCSIELKQTI
jgi:cell division protein FtsI (penicillin-binding protein 3)